MNERETMDFVERVSKCVADRVLIHMDARLVTLEVMFRAHCQGAARRAVTRKWLVALCLGLPATIAATLGLVGAL